MIIKITKMTNENFNFFSGPKPPIKINRHFLTLLWIIFCSVIRVSGTSEVKSGNVNITRHLDQSFFVTQIFEKYGDDKVMTYEGFEHLLESLGLGRLKFETKHDVSIHKLNGTFKDLHDELHLHRHHHNVETSNEISEQKSNGEKHRIRKRNIYDAERPISEGFHRAKTKYSRICLTPQDILKSYGFEPSHDVVISQTTFIQMCPAIIYELDQKSCRVEATTKNQNEEQEYYLVWIYASVSIFIMSVAGLLCVAIVPIINKSYYEAILQFLVSLAVGTLCGDALIHLLPQALSYDPVSESDTTSVLRGTVALFSIFLFFIIESVLKIIQNKKLNDRQGKTQQSVNECGKILTLEVENQEGFHGHGHGHSHGVEGVKTIAWMVIMGDVLHNISDGLSIGASFSSSITSGFASSIAIFCHELPHELGDYAVLLRSGMSIKRSLFYNVVSSIFSFIGMVAGVLLGEIEYASLWINSFTAGSFLYIALSDLIPEMKADADENSGIWNIVLQLLGIFLGGVLMFTIALYEEELENLLS